MIGVIRWTLWQRRWAIMWWSIGVVAFIALELGVYPSIRSQAHQLNQTLKDLPDSVRSLFGFTQDPFSAVGYLNSRLYYLLLPLIFSILAIGLGSSLIAREESDGTLELLLSRPISRGKLILAKILSALIILAIITAASTLAILILTKIVNLNVPLGSVAFTALLASLLAMIFGMVAFVISAMGAAGRGASMGIAAFVGLATYVITSFEDQVHWLSWPSKLLPYHYYDPPKILYGTITWTVVIAYSVIIVVLGILSWLAFRHRDVGV